MTDTYWLKPGAAVEIDAVPHRRGVVQNFTLQGLYLKTVAEDRNYNRTNPDWRYGLIATEEFVPWNAIGSIRRMTDAEVAIGAGAHLELFKQAGYTITEVE